MKPKLTIHAGANKTGSSAIQRFLAENREQMSAAGVIIPDVGMGADGRCEGHQVWYFHDRRAVPAAAAQRELADKIGALMAIPNTKQVVLSAENLGNSESHFAQWFTQISKHYNTELVLYIRRQDDLLLSSWQQWHVKTHDDFWAWISSCIGVIGNWRRIVEEWEGVLGRENIHLRLFERKKLVNGDIVDDFCQFVLVDARILSNDRRKTINPSYNEAIVDLVAGGKFFKDAHDNEFYRFLESYLGEVSHRRSRESVLGVEQRLAIIQRYTASNAWIRDNYFAHVDVPATLFTMPRSVDYEMQSTETLRKEQLQMLAQILFEMHKKGSR